MYLHRRPAVHEQGWAQVLYLYKADRDRRFPILTRGYLAVPIHLELIALTIISVSDEGLGSLSSLAHSTCHLLAHLLGGFLGLRRLLGDDLLGLGNALDTDEFSLKDYSTNSQSAGETPKTGILHQPATLAGQRTKSRASRDRADSAFAVAVAGTDGQRPLLANAHVQKTLVPSVGHCQHRAASLHGILGRPYPLITCPPPRLKLKGCPRS
jgi:hypothetical protein